MAFKYPTQDLFRLLRIATLCVKNGFDKQGAIALASAASQSEVDPLRDKYLENLFSDVRKALKNNAEYVARNQSFIEVILRFVQLTDWKEFLTASERIRKGWATEKIDWSSFTELSVCAIGTPAIQMAYNPWLTAAKERVGTPLFTQNLQSETPANTIEEITALLRLHPLVIWMVPVAAWSAYAGALQTESGQQLLASGQLQLIQLDENNIWQPNRISSSAANASALPGLLHAILIANEQLTIALEASPPDSTQGLPPNTQIGNIDNSGVFLLGNVKGEQISFGDTHNTTIHNNPEK